MPWPIVPLGDVAEWGSGGTPKRSESTYFGPGVPWLSIADLNDGPVRTAKESLTHLGLENSSAKVVPPGTLFVAMYGSIGKLGIAQSDLSMSQAIAFAKPDINRLDVRYLFHFLMGERPRLLAKGRGGTQMNIGQSDLKSWPIPLPPIEEQRLIAGILDRAEALRAKRRAALTNLDDLMQSIFLDMFGNPRSDWAETTVSDLVDRDRGGIRTGPFGSQLLHSEFVDKGIAVLGIDNAVRNHFGWDKQRFITPAKYQGLQRYRVWPGDVLITIMGTCGRAAVVPDDVPLAINTKHLCCITLDRRRCLPEYLHAYFLRHPVARAYLDRTAKGAIMSGLNMGIVKAMPVSLPPIELQCEFVAKLRATEGAIDACLSQLAEFDELFQTLQRRAFAGLL